MRDFFKDTIKLIFIFVIFFIIVSIVVSVLVYFIAGAPKIDLIFDGKIEFSQNILRINAAAIIVLTIMLICGGWLQLERLNKTSKADFLLQIVARYSSKEIVDARAIIQKLYRIANPENNSATEERYIQLISDEIDKIRNDPEKNNECALLLNLLDFLEAISYFTRKNFITVRDIDELVGNSILYYYKIYKRWIYSRRERYDNSYYYCEFELLAKKIESHMIKTKIAETCFLMRVLNFFY